MSITIAHNKRRPITHLGNMATIRIPAKVSEQIRFLHDQVGHVEWSGMLMMKVQGGLDDIDSLVVDVAGIFPCNIGTVGGTEYSMSDHMDDAFEQFPEWDFIGGDRWDGKTAFSGTKVGQIHTHHSLTGGAYFSSVDDGDLDANVSSHGMYVSLIVAMDGSYVCKGAVLAEAKVASDLDLSDYDTKLEFSPTVAEHLVTFDFNIEYDTEDWLENRLWALKDAKVLEDAARANSKTLGTITNWSKYKKPGTPEFVPMTHQLKTLETAGFNYEFHAGYGNIYTDTFGVHWNDLGEVVSDEEFTDIQMLNI